MALSPDTSASKTLTVRQFFGRSGKLSKWHPNYEFREGQLLMAEAVEAALKDKKHLIVEAGTGTGKTLAYLVPAILSGKRIVVSTGTKNLQEQLYFKDIPFLEQHLGELRTSYMKGRANYACRQKIYDAEKEPILEGLEEVADFQIIRKWEETTETGDRAEIKTLPENSSTWAKIDARSDNCTGQKCPQFERCFITLMHQKAQASDLIIVNHHLFFADLAVKGNERAAIIPDYAAVIFDEAHEIEDTAGQYFGVSISSAQIEDLARDVVSLAHRKQFGSEELDRTLITLSDRSAQFFGLFGTYIAGARFEGNGARGSSGGNFDGRTGFHDHEAFLESYEEQYRDVLYALEIVGLHLELIQQAPEEAIPLVARCRDLARRLEFWMEGTAKPLASPPNAATVPDDENAAGDEEPLAPPPPENKTLDNRYVYWIERRGRRTFLQATPIEVSQLLDERLFDAVDTVVLTSATMAVAGGFDYVQQRLGLRSARTEIVESHFDYPNQALLYVPQHLPDPRNQAFTKAAAEEIADLLILSRGRAFVLFTSYTQMRLVYDRVSLEIPYDTLLQGTGPRSALLDEFRNTPNCVLFATSSFWQGVDVPGDQLSLVIIDKLPFAVPSDPVVQARIAAIKDEGGDAFHNYQVPQAAIALKQGFGRLIRSKTDRGVLVLLDNRITKTRYGQIFFDSLPDYGFTMARADVGRFFDRNQSSVRPPSATSSDPIT